MNMRKLNTVGAKRKPEKIQAYRDSNPAGLLDTDAASALINQLR